MPELSDTPLGDCIADDLARDEELIRLSALRNEKFIPRARNGKKLDKSVIRRWVNPGCRGVQLEVMAAPVILHTTRSAVLRFFQARKCNTAPSPAFTRPTPARRRRQIEAASRELAEAGIL